MNKIIKLLCFLSLMLFYSSSIFAQCGVGEMKIVKYPNSIKSSMPVKVKVTFWNMCDNDGNNCYELLDVQNVVSQVKTEFLKYNISIEACIIQNNNSSQDFLSDLNDHPAPQKCGTINYRYHRFGLPPDFGGMAGETSAWSYLGFSVTMHELGHIFGLPHTFNCVGPSENIKRPNCDPAGPNCQATCIVNCDTTGDGFCDTPADKQPNAGQNPVCDDVLTLTTTGGIPRLVNLGNHTDDCGNLYHDDEDILLRNFMSYTFNFRTNFTDEQADHMYNKIINDLSEFIGTQGNCSAETPEYMYCDDILSGSISNKNVLVFDGIDVDLHSLQLTNSYIIIKNSTIGLIGSLKLVNSNLILKNTILTNADGVCKSEKWAGVQLFDGSQLQLWGESEINNVWGIGIDIRTENCKVRVGKSKVISPTTAITANVDAQVIIFEESEIKGNISILGQDDNKSALYISNSSIDANGFFGSIIDLNETYFQLLESEVYNSILGIQMNGGTCQIRGSNFYDITEDGNYFNNLDGLWITNSYFEGLSMFSANALNYDIGFNQFDNCSGVCANSSIIRMNSSNDVENRIANNIIEVPSKGISSQGDQTKLKFLCNDFNLTDEFNFDWQIVDQIQGEGIGIASGNLFSNTNNKVKGISPGSTYQFNDLNPEEILNPNDYTNMGLTSLLVGIPAAGCEYKGPNWNLTNDDPNDFSYPDIVDGCPLGIDCSQPCPSGIDCTVTCPPGINCLENCPPGIDCSQPCPPGIDCSQPCPPGVNCSEPTIPEFEEGTHNSVDEVITFLDNQYNTFGMAYSHLNIVNSLNTKEIQLQNYGNIQNWKNAIFQNVISNNKKLALTTVLEILDNAKEFTENEVVDILKGNPESLFAIDVIKIVFNTNSFKQFNLQEIMNSKSNWLESKESLNFRERYDLESKMSRISKFALKRLTISQKNSHEAENIWFSRLNSLAAELAIVNNFVKIGDFSSSLSLLATLKNNPEYHDLEIQDLGLYEDIINLLLELSYNDLSMSELNPNQVQLLETISDINLRYSASKARGILSTFYDEELIKGAFTEYVPSQLEFLEQEDALTRSTTEFKIYPTVNSGTFVIEADINEATIFQLFSLDGKVVASKKLKSPKTELKLELGNGLYFYKICSLETKEYTGKLIIN